jgi:hypothetical protein
MKKLEIQKELKGVRNVVPSKPSPPTLSPSLPTNPPQLTVTPKPSLPSGLREPPKVKGIPVKKKSSPDSRRDDSNTPPPQEAHSKPSNKKPSGSKTNHSRRDAHAKKMSKGMGEPS